MNEDSWKDIQILSRRKKEKEELERLKVGDDSPIPLEDEKPRLADVNLLLQPSTFKEPQSLWTAEVVSTLQNNKMAGAVQRDSIEKSLVLADLIKKYEIKGGSYVKVDARRIVMNGKRSSENNMSRRV